jgi:hypothetical protein
VKGADAVEPVDETAESIIEAASAAGHDLSREQLIRLHQHGLVPRPHQVSRGAGGGRGKATVYPSGTTDLVLRICELRRSEHRLDELGWLAWWTGLPIPDRLARRYLAAQAADFLQTKGELFTDDGELADKALDALDASPDAQLDQLPMRWARRRVGTGEFDWFLDRLLMVVAGRTDELTSEDLGLLERGIGLDRARTDKLATTGAPWLDSDPRADFETIAERVAPEAIEKALNSASDEQLSRARDKAKAFAAVVSNLGSVLRETGDRWSYGFAAFGAIFDRMLSTPAQQAQFVLFLLSCVEADGSEGLEQIIAQNEQATLTLRSHEAIKALREAVPEVAAAIPLKTLGKAMSDATYQEKINARLGELRQAHGDEIDAFFAEQPEHRVSEGS